MGVYGLTPTVPNRHESHGLPPTVLRTPTHFMSSYINGMYIQSPGLSMVDRYAISDHAFTSFLQKSWTTLSLSEEETATLQLLAAAFMAFFWVRP